MDKKPKIYVAGHNGMAGPAIKRKLGEERLLGLPAKKQNTGI